MAAAEGAAAPDSGPGGPELRAVWAHSRVYALATVLNRSAGVVLVPLYAHVLPASEFGTYAIVMMVADLVAVGFGTSFSNGMFRVYFDYEDQADRDRVVTTTLISLGLATLAMTALLYPLARLSSYLLFGSSAYGGLFGLAYLGVMLALVFEVGLNSFRLAQRSWVVLWASAAKVLLFLSLNVVFVVVLRMGVTGIFLGTLVGSLVLALVLSGIIVKRAGLSCSRSMLRAILGFGIPLLPAVLADAVTDMSDRYVLNRLASVGAVGQYALGGRVAWLLHMFISMPFGQIWVVRRFESLRRRSADSVESAAIFTYFVIVITTAALAIALLAPEIVRVVASADYLPAAVVVPVLGLSYMVVALNMHLQIGLYHAKETKLLVAISLVCVAVSLPLNYLLVPMLGLVGAAAATLVNSALRASLTAWLAARYCGVPLGLEWRRVGVVVTLAAGLYALTAAALGAAVSVGVMAAKLGVIAAFVVLVLFGGVVSAEERTSLAVLLTKRGPAW